ncbi:uncharacterized protein BCR38DRAFT_339786 [Pseudomassariella vexata]|uniref:Protoporphyrinogen oxidase n=1 Tax=Pseudomassariella vexata TaxID=1141098 RepID=A0A1Y2E4I6_9PEZI|nr:uncharacterized protein BCR38DRAFT_339786 [Pseudomassariella vexata]ORY66206.1 hypothetical protein BCR38DRAFT_339786 [Pseudomassariella vexata]
MASKHPEELFIALLRSAYGNSCRRVVNRRHRLLASKLPSTRALSVLRNSSARTARSIDQLEPGHGGCRGNATAATREKSTKSTVRPPRNIAVLGGGITGLTAAHYLARHATNAHITIYESSDRLGGWLDGKTVDIGQGEGSSVLVQRGPRMLRSGATSNKYDDLVLYDVLANLDLQDKVLYPEGAANSRYVYYPDHLVKLPSAEPTLDNVVDMIRSYFTEPLWNGCFWAYMYWRQASSDPEIKRAQMQTPIKVKTNKRNGEPIQNIVSAMLHGIYGGDIWKLSAKHTIFDRFWYQDRDPISDSLLWMARKEWSVKNDILEGPNLQHVIKMAEKLRTKNLLAFEDGLVTLVDKLVADLAGQENVTIKYNAPVTSLANKENYVEISSTDGNGGKYDQVLSTLFSGQLARLTQPANALPSLAKTKAVTIMVVNLWYPNPDLLKANLGFGYLIPQSVAEEENSECALGVLFDSCLETRPETPGTKLTVMLGGHYWDNWTFYPSEETAIQMAKSVVRRHLGIPESEKVTASAKLCRECLPQQTVGHRERMTKAHYELLGAFKGKLMVAGPSYTNIGVIPAMRAGFDAGMRMAKGHGPPWFRNDEMGHWSYYMSWHRAQGLPEAAPDHVGSTGLEWATESEHDSMWTMEKTAMYFRQWTPEDRVWTDGEGNWKSEAARGSVKKELDDSGR